MPHADPSDSKRILIVDDEPLNRELLRRVLQSEYVIDEAEDADAAVGVLEGENEFAAVLCDQLMPGRCGTDLAGDVKARWPRVKFLLITGYDDDPQVLEAKAAGKLHEVVTKPWTARGLKELLRTMLV
jgi:CheY-like chemotaxis protein